MKWTALMTMMVAALPRKGHFVQTVNTRLQTFKEKYPDATAMEIAASMWTGGIRILLAKFYLRNCETGRLVSVNGKPVIDNKGVMVFEDHVRIWSDVVQAKLYTEKKGVLLVGSNSRLNGVHISARYSVIIGKNVRIAPYTIIMDSDFHDVRDHFSEGERGAVTIEDDVWIATRATILKGVTIGKGSVVAAGAVVTSDVPPGSIVAGVPARVIRYLSITLMSYMVILSQALQEWFEELLQFEAEEAQLTGIAMML